MSGDGLDVRFQGAIGGFSLNVAFQAPATGVTALFGPSGCGKTSVLRCVAGLSRLAEGYCAIGGEIWQEGRAFRPTHRRAIGYVFQEPSLFPHLSVAGNLRYGRWRGREAAIDFAALVDLLGLAPLLDRAPRHLSGGERQRVAIGRALLSGPRLLLFDEPLAALDADAKLEILGLLERVRATLSVPALYVSHDMAEIERLADHLILMERGRVRAAGALADLQSDPALPLMRSRSATVSLDARVTGHDPRDGISIFAVDGGEFLASTRALAIGARCRLRVAASDVGLTLDPPARSSILNIPPARVIGATPTGEHDVTAVLGLGVDGAGARVLARVTRRSWESLGLAPGDAVHAMIKAVAVDAGGAFS